MVGVALHAGVKIIDRLGNALAFVATNSRAELYEGSVPCPDSIARMLGGLFSDDRRSFPIQCVAGRQAVYGESRIFTLSSDGAFVVTKLRFMKLSW